MMLQNMLGRLHILYSADLSKFPYTARQAATVSILYSQIE